MEKTKLGVNPAFYALVAYLIAIFDSRWILVGFLLFVIAVEKNEWAIKHTIQALTLTYIFSALWILIGMIPVSDFTSFISGINYDVGSALYKIYTYFLDFIKIIIYIIYIIITVKAVKGGEAGLPIVNKVIDLFYGKKNETKTQ